MRYLPLLCKYSYVSNCPHDRRDTESTCLTGGIQPSLSFHPKSLRMVPEVEEPAKKTILLTIFQVVFKKFLYINQELLF